jgi:hypothetical protein
MAGATRRDPIIVEKETSASRDVRKGSKREDRSPEGWAIFGTQPAHTKISCYLLLYNFNICFSEGVLQRFSLGIQGIGWRILGSLEGFLSREDPWGQKSCKPQMRATEKTKIGWMDEWMD